MAPPLRMGVMEIGVGLGYAVSSAASACRCPTGFPARARGLTSAFTGERFSFHGRRYHFTDTCITRGYFRPGGPPLWVAALAEAGALRAARFGANLLPQSPRARALDPWHAALRQAGAIRRTIASASSAPAWSPTMRSVTSR